MYEDFQLAGHTGDDFPEWGSSPRRPLVVFDMAHKGEWLDSVIGPDPLTGDPMIYHIVRCELCIAIHVWPLPSAAVLTHYYMTTFYQQDKPEYLERTARDRIWWESCVWRPLLQQCLDAVHEPVRPLSAPFRLLDIGCGPAVSLNVAACMGMQTYGIEPNRAVADLAQQRGHIVYAGTLEDSPFTTPGIFDLRQCFQIITAYEVLEHQVCPDDFLLRCYDLLEPGGVLMIEVPNDYSPIQLLAREQLHEKPWWLAPPQHLFHWSPKTLQLCLRRAGFTILDMRGTYPLDQALLQGQNYIGNDVVGRQVHTARMQWELDMLQKGKWSQVEAEYRANLYHRIGREIVCIARKEAG